MTYLDDRSRKAAEYYHARRRTDPEWYCEHVSRTAAKRQSCWTTRLKHMLAQARKRASTKGLEFNLTFEYVMGRLKATDFCCEMTGAPLVIAAAPDARKFQRNPWAPSLDRKDSTLGYTPENVQLVANIYNQAKNDGLDSDVLELARLLLRKTTQET